MSILASFKKLIYDTASLADHMDTDAAEEEIKSSMYFKGPNVWILAFSVIIACVGLNVNSIPVIIGAMLISPLMGPIYAMGLGLGTNDLDLFRAAVKNLFIMVAIALMASALYFFLSPLKIVAPTELEARVNPSLYDILIAIFGGLAGIFEISRKGSGRTVIPGVAIATALMPPLCTAGYGLAKFNLHYLLGALLLFTINMVFITLATYFMVKTLKFKQRTYTDENVQKRVKNWLSIVIIAIMIPSIWSAINMIRYNNFQMKVDDFVSANRQLDRAYIYESSTENKKGMRATIYIAGEILKSDTKQALLNSARDFGLSESQIIIKEQNLAGEEEDNSEVLLRGIYERTDMEINKKEAQVRALESELNALRAVEIPYVQIAKEVQSQYPEIKQISIAKGEIVSLDSLSTQNRMVVIAATDSPLGTQKTEKLSSWLKIRLSDSTVVVLNPRPDGKK